MPQDYEIKMVQSSRRKLEEECKLVLVERAQSFCRVAIVQRSEIKPSIGYKLWNEQFSQSFNSSVIGYIYFKLDLGSFSWETYYEELK